MKKRIEFSVIMYLKLIRMLMKKRFEFSMIRVKVNKMKSFMSIIQFEMMKNGAKKKNDFLPQFWRVK